MQRASSAPPPAEVHERAGLRDAPHAALTSTMARVLVGSLEAKGRRLVGSV
jgi:hypothetical protein